MIQLANAPGVWLLLAVPALFALAVFSRWLARRRAARWGGPAMLRVTALAPSLEWDMVRSACLWLGLLLAALAYARPQWGEVVESLGRTGLDVVVVLDTSRSMRVKDLPGDRLDRAKLELRSFLSGDEGDRVGLVAAAGVPIVLSPLTEDTGAITMFLDVCDEELIPAEGTDLGRALADAVRLFPTDAERDKVLLLVSDGEDMGDDAYAAARTAASLNAKLFCWGAGTAKGGLIPGADGKPVEDPDTKAPAVSRLDEVRLKQLSTIADGRYWSLETEGDVAAKMREEFGRLKRMEYASKTQARRQDHYGLFLGPAVGLLLLGWAIPGRRRRPEDEKGGSRA